MTEGFAAVVTLKVKPDKLERFKARLSEIGRAMSREKEFKHAWVHVLADDPTTIVIYEAWSCNVDYFMNNLFKKPYRHDYEAELTDMLREDRRRLPAGKRPRPTQANRGDRQLTGRAVMHEDRHSPEARNCCPEAGNDWSR